MDKALQRCRYAVLLLCGSTLTILICRGTIVVSRAGVNALPQNSVYRCALLATNESSKMIRTLITNKVDSAKYL